MSLVVLIAPPEPTLCRTLIHLGLEQNPMNASTTIAADLAKGAAAGAAGVWIMDRVDWFMVEHGDQEAWRQTQEVRPNHKDPAHNMAGVVAKAIGAEPPSQPHPAGIAIHYAVGMAPAAFYALNRRRLPGGPLSRGLLFGLGMFIVEDEVLNPLAGLAAPPGRYPWQAHARGLISHLVLGVVTEAILSALDRRNDRTTPAPATPRASSEREKQGRAGLTFVRQSSG